MKILFNKTTGKTVRYNRADDEIVDNLDPIYDVLTCREEAKPDCPDTHYLQPSSERVGDEWVTSWEAKPKPVMPLPGITQSQIRIALLNRGLLDDVQPAIDSLPEPERSMADIRWKKSTIFLRAHPMVNAIGALLQLTSETMDEIFHEAAAL